MLVCIPTVGDRGLNDKVHEHFGSAPFFTLYDTETEEVNVLSNRNAHHDHGTCHPMNQLVRYHINCVVCGGMGRRAVEALNAEGIKIYLAGGDTVQAVVEQLKASALEEIDPLRACRGHGQRHDLGPGDLGRGSGYGPGLQGGGHGRGRCGDR